MHLLSHTCTDTHSPSRPHRYGARTFRHHLWHVARVRPDLLVHVGDMVHEGRRLKEWRTYWTGPLEQAALGSSLPVLAARGNHDGETPPAFAYLQLPPTAVSPLAALATSIPVPTLASSSSSSTTSSSSSTSSFVSASSSSSTTPRKHHHGGGGGWFAYTAGPIRFIVLNTNLPPALGGDDAQTQVRGPHHFHSHTVANHGE
jgi:hypothetical protein